MIHRELEQGTEEWLALRCGKLTASRIGDLMAKGRGGGESAGRQNYVAELIAERMTGEPYPHYRSKEMEWGTEHESEARLVYELRTGSTVDEVAFVDHPTIERAGASPDGLVGDDGAIEIKCPNTATHLKTLDDQKIKQSYLWQCQWVLACAERRWIDWMSYDPRLPDHLALVVIRVYRDDSMIAEAEGAVRAADKEIETTIARLMAHAGANQKSAEEIF